VPRDGSRECDLASQTRRQCARQRGTERTRELNPSVLFDDHAVNQFYDLRLILEPAAAERAATHRSGDDLLAMRRALTHFRVAYEMGTPVWETDIEFHQAIADASGNAMLAKVLAPLSDLLRNARRATGTLPAAVDLALHEHDEIAAAINARATRRARRAMTTHIESNIWAVTQLEDTHKSKRTPPSQPRRR
jgi:DNA-binding FadR family transcriptional regulator